jgi:hypothetical protein
MQKGPYKFEDNPAKPNQALQPIRSCIGRSLPPALVDLSFSPTAQETGCARRSHL